MKKYLEFMREHLENGNEKTDRTGTGTLSLFGRQMIFDLSKGFPLVTTKKLHLKSIIHELLWFLKGDTNIKYLNDNGVKIWDSWADGNGDLGPIYGYQWRGLTPYSNSIAYDDQIKSLIKDIKNNPDSRRLIVDSWNVECINYMALAPCHCLFQFYVNNGKLSCKLYQRSADIFLGVPFNIASYALLTQMIAQVCDLEVGEFIHTFGDSHIYTNHIEQCKTQLKREVFKLPRMELNPDVKNIFDFKYEDFKLIGYESHESIKGEIAV